MPGITFAGSRISPGTPIMDHYPLANSLVGSAAAPNSPLQQYDLVALSTKASLTDANSTAVLRQLLIADRGLNTGSPNGYKAGTPIAGILGLVQDGAQTNALGQVTGGPVSAGGVINSVPSQSAGIGIDRVTNRMVAGVYLFRPGNLFRGRIDMNPVDWPNGLTNTTQFTNQLAGIVPNFQDTAPTGLTIAANAAASSLPVGNYYVVVSYYGSSGETQMSVPALVTTTLGTPSILVTAPGAKTGYAYYRVYIGTAATGPFYLQNATYNGINLLNGSGTLLASNYTQSTALFLNSPVAPVAGYTNYTLQPAAGVGGIGAGAIAALQCVRIIRPDRNFSPDNNYGSLVVPGSPLGPGVIFEALDTFSQSLTGVNYTAQ